MSDDIDNRVLDALLDKVSRVEVIDHSKTKRGRAFVATRIRASIELQDNGRTLKIFVDDLQVVDGGREDNVVKLHE